MADILNVKMGSKNLLYILFKMKIENKPYGLNFELWVYLQTILQLESLIAKYFQLKSSFYILYLYFFIFKNYIIQ
jgi:hypothetical protein